MSDVAFPSWPNRIGRLVLRVDNVRGWRDLVFRLGIVVWMVIYFLGVGALVFLLAAGVLGELQLRERARADAEEAHLDAKLDGIRLEIEELREQLVGGSGGECAP
jgi:hypothetical protein